MSRAAPMIHFTGTAHSPTLKLKRSNMTHYATAPDPIPSRASYLTPGKRYEIRNSRGNPANTLFEITDDSGVTIACLASGCCHLEGDWLITDDEDTP